ncbi:hypothetical protein BELL_0019g00010 [Botrytis elliptica]|uniref:Uncharacterized protein n=1 Tax=Botrytis elliptica TaxID=278938 RepID=A0A4Z1KFE1_9HELO|nr:hypothetical protein EAE99_000182 [Botrytis elliptica]TGO79913.1 hypothetical protein BELL_0019g00010 [Botrytis elliptica]
MGQEHPTWAKNLKKSKQNCPLSLFSACRNLFADWGCLPIRRDAGGVRNAVPVASVSDIGGMGDTVPMTSIPDTTGIGSPIPMTSIPDVEGIRSAVPMTSVPHARGIKNPIPMPSIPDIPDTRNTAPTTSIPDVTEIRDAAPIEHNDTNTLSEKSQAEGKTNQIEGLSLAQRLRLIEQRGVQLEASHDSTVSITSCSLPLLPSGNFPITFPNPVLTTVSNTVPTTIPVRVDTTVNTEVPIEVPTTIPVRVDTTIPTTVETTVDTTVDESNLSPADDKQPFLSITLESTTVETTLNTTVDKLNLPATDDEQPSFPYTIYDFTKSGLVISEISGIHVREQYHQIMEIVGQACGICPKCTSDNRAQDLIDTIIEMRFPDLDSALFRDGILSEFGFDDYWNELIVAKPEVRKGYVKYENWYAKVWEDIEANNELPAISKAIEKEFAQSRDFRRILAGKQYPRCKWRKRGLLLFVMRMRRIRGKLEERPQTQEKQETQTIETSANKNRKTRDKEKRRKVRDREDKVAAKLLHDTLEELKRVTAEANACNYITARRENKPFAEICPPEVVYSVWEEQVVFLLFINIPKFVSLVKLN